MSGRIKHVAHSPLDTETGNLSIVLDGSKLCVFGYGGKAIGKRLICSGAKRIKNRATTRYLTHHRAMV